MIVKCPSSSFRRTAGDLGLHGIAHLYTSEYGGKKHDIIVTTLQYRAFLPMWPLQCRQSPKQPALRCDQSTLTNVAGDPIRFIMEGKNQRGEEIHLSHRAVREETEAATEKTLGRTRINPYVLP